MQFQITQTSNDKQVLYIIDDLKQIDKISGLSAEQLAYAKAQLGPDKSFVTLNLYKRYVWIYLYSSKKTEAQSHDACRKQGADLQAMTNRQKVAELCIDNLSHFHLAAYLVAEGMAMANYQFLTYRTDAKKLTNALKKISFTKQSATLKEVQQLQIIIDAIYKVRTLVNEPVNSLSAEGLAKAISVMAKEAGFKISVLHKAQITKEKMGGLLAVNRGSKQPPTFSIMEYKPARSINKKPIVLVGKGIVYDTGGLSLKPTPNSMDRMKSDMSGAALVSGAMYTIAKLKLPLHVIALAPATDNRPGEEAYTPGDIITMYDGTFVEVMNTDAEGRLILADALHYAKRYKPELVLDFATLTGAASAAVGEHGIVCMGTAEESVKHAFKQSGFRQYERLVEFPLWDEYGDMIKSDYADLKNVGGPTGGAITAGKFLEHFTDYPWMHFDIAGVSFATAKKGYTTIGGTAYGMRMLLDFLAHYGKA